MKRRQGYAAISRSVQDNFLWKAEPFTKGQAWIDLILYANWKDTQEIDRGEVLEIKRGQFYASDGFWVERWQWSRNKVRAYFALLEKEGMIKRITSRRRTVYTIVKYKEYQPSVESDDTTESITEGITESTTERITEGTSKGTQHKKDKNINSIRKVKKDDEFISNDMEDDDLTREEELNIVDMNRLITVFGENFSEHTKREYLNLKANYEDEVLHEAFEKAMVLGAKTIAYVQKILSESRALRVG